MRSLASAPDLLDTLMPWLGHVMGETSLDLATKELVILRVAHLSRCRYCLAAHIPPARDAGVDVDAVCDASATEKLPPRERVLVEWTDRVTLEPASVTDELVARMLDHVREDELIELTLLAGTTRMLTQYCTAFDLPPPADA